MLKMPTKRQVKSKAKSAKKSAKKSTKKSKRRVAYGCPMPWLDQELSFGDSNAQNIMMNNGTFAVGRRSANYPAHQYFNLPTPLPLGGVSQLVYPFY